MRCGGIGIGAVIGAKVATSGSSPVAEGAEADLARSGRPAGVHALPVTSEGKLVLVRLNYARGWRLPGGGYKRDETTIAAVLRELEEEIGLTSYSTVTQLNPDDPDPIFGNVFVVRDVEYTPRRSLEVDEVREFSVDDLPDKLVSRLGGYLDHAR